MKEFKFRAECMGDVEDLLEILDGAKVPCVVNVEKVGGLPDVEVMICVTSETDISVDDLRAYMRKVEDGHVMVQTLATADCYTGARNFEA